MIKILKSNDQKKALIVAIKKDTLCTEKQILKKKKAHFPLEKMLVRRQCNKLLADLKTLKFQLRRLYLEK